MEQSAGQASSFEKKAEQNPGPAAGPTIGPASACGGGRAGSGPRGPGCVQSCGCRAAWRPPSAASPAQETEWGEQDVLTLAVGAARARLSCDPVCRALIAHPGDCTQRVSAFLMPASRALLRSSVLLPLGSEVPALGLGPSLGPGSKRLQARRILLGKKQEEG